MSSALRVVFACLAVFGAVMVVLMILGILHWILIAAVILGVGYGLFRLASPGRKPLETGDASLHKKLKQLDTDVRKHTGR